jgi:hypothetical protein
LCQICNFSGRKNLSTIRGELATTLSRIDISKLETNEKLLLDEFRSHAALLFSDVNGYSSEFSTVHAGKLTNLISELRKIASNGFSDVGLSMLAGGRLSSNLVDLELQMTSHVEHASARASGGFKCREESM